MSVTPENLTTWRNTFTGLDKMSDEKLTKLAEMFKQPFIEKPYALELQKQKIDNNEETL